MNSFEVLVSIAEDLELLFLVLGTLFIILSFFKISGKIELISQEDRNKVRVVGAFLFIVGCASCLYPDSVEISGTISYWDNTPAVGATIEIDGKTATVDPEGNYRINNISRKANRITFDFNRSSCWETIDIPFYSLSVKKSKKGERKNMTIWGTVYDEFNIPVNNRTVLITGGIPLEKETGHKSNFTDSDGQYIISNVSCDPRYPMFISVLNSRVQDYKTSLVFAGEETRIGFKLIDIYLPSKHTIDVYGEVTEKGRYSYLRTPMSDVFVEMGGLWSSITDAQGNYSIENVPRNVTVYNITDEFGEKIATNLIKPPLNAASLKDKVIKRTLPI